MLYQSQYLGEFVLPSGVKLSIGDTGDADPENLGIQMAIADGWLIEVEPEPAKRGRTPKVEPEPEKE